MKKDKKIIVKIVFIIISLILLLSIANLNVLAAWEIYAEDISMPSDSIELMQIMNELLSIESADLSADDKEKYNQVAQKLLNTIQTTNQIESFSSSDINTLKSKISTTQEDELEVNPAFEWLKDNNNSSSNNNSGIKYGTEDVGVYSLTWKEILDQKYFYNYDITTRVQAMEAYMLTGITEIESEDWDKFLDGWEILLENTDDIKANSTYTELYTRLENKMKLIATKGTLLGMTDEQEKKAKEIYAEVQSAEQDAIGNEKLQNGGTATTKKTTTETQKNENTFEDPLENLTDWDPLKDDWDEDKLMEKAAKVLAVINIIGIAVAVIALVLIGIKYMLGSVEQKAEYKKALVPYVIGISLLASVSTIPNIIFNLVKGILA